MKCTEIFMQCDREAAQSNDVSEISSRDHHTLSATAYKPNRPCSTDNKDVVQTCHLHATIDTFMQPTPEGAWTLAAAAAGCDDDE